MRKKMIAAVMCMVIGFSAVSCGKKGDDTKGTGTTPETTPTVEATATPEAETTPTGEPTSDEGTQPEGNGEDNAIDGRKYSSDTYGFELTVPENYVIFDEETSSGIIYQSMATLYESVDAMMQAFDTMGIKYPFIASTTKPAAANASANIITQLVPASTLPGSLEDILNQTLSSTEQQYLALGVTPTLGEAKMIQVDGKDISVADCSVLLDGDLAGTTYDNFTIYQKLLCFESGSNRIMVTCTYYNDEEAKGVEEMVDTIRILK